MVRDFYRMGNLKKSMKYNYENIMQTATQFSLSRTTMLVCLKEIFRITTVWEWSTQL